MCGGGVGQLVEGLEARCEADWAGQFFPCRPFSFFFSFLFFLSVFSSSWFAARAWARKYDQSLHVLRHVMKIGDREGSVESAGSAESAERVERSQPHAIAPGLPRPRQTRAALRI